MSSGVQPGPGELAAVATARKRLDEEHRRLAAIIAGLEAEGLRAESEAESISEIASVSQHPADTASETFERERDLTLLDEATAALADVDRAMAKLSAGRYGACERCHQPIDPERLEARPAARFCLAHEERYEMGGPHLTELTATGGPRAALAGVLPSGEEEDFLATDDELEPSASERTDGPEFGAVGARRDAELADDELGDELASAGLLEDEMGEALIDLQLGPDEVDEELEAEELEEEELAEEELEGAEAGAVEGVEEEALPEDVEASLDELLRIQFGLGEEAAEEEELDEEAVVGEEQPRLAGRRADEFLCMSCFQLKHRSLLADLAGTRCIDCANNRS